MNQTNMKKSSRSLYLMTNYNPKSLQNLRPNWNSETAKKAQEKGLETRKKNKEAREKLKLTLEELKLTQDEVFSKLDVDALSVLKLAMTKAIQEDDMDEATRLATIIAEYQAPKLQRVDQTNLELNTDSISDEDLDKMINELKNDQG